MLVVLAQKAMVSVFSASRSDKARVAVLGTTKDKPPTDGYTEHNKATTPFRRDRAGCIAHAKRRFFDTLDHELQVPLALNLVRNPDLPTDDRRKRSGSRPGSRTLAYPGKPRIFRRLAPDVTSARQSDRLARTSPCCSLRTSANL